MRKLVTLSLVSLMAVAGAQAQRAPENIRPKVVEQPPDRVVITGMVPIPDVGPGAPQFTSADVAELGKLADKTATKASRDYRTCGGGALPKSFEPAAMPLNTSFDGPAVNFDLRPGSNLYPSTLELLGREYAAANAVASLAEKAETATEAAEAARRGAAAGETTMKDVEAAELVRQEAVRKLQFARAALVEAQAVIGDWQHYKEMKRPDPTWSELEGRSIQRDRDNVGLGIAVPEVVDGLTIENIKARQVKNKKGEEIVLVSGDLVNSVKKSIQIPALSVALVDERGWILANMTVTTQYFGTIGAGKRKPFQVEMTPAPEALHTAVVSVAAKSHVEPRLNVHCRGRGF